jgi:hypothetical protein
VAWELYYGIVIPSNQFESIAFLAWFVVDLVLVLVTIRYARRQGSLSIFMRHAAFIIWIGVMLMLLLYAKFATYYADTQEAAFWSGLFSQVILSWNGPVHLVTRQSVKGHSLKIWCVRSNEYASFAEVKIVLMIFPLQVLSLIGDAVCNLSLCMASSELSIQLELRQDTSSGMFDSWSGDSGFGLSVRLQLPQGGRNSREEMQMICGPEQ